MINELTKKRSETDEEFYERASIYYYNNGLHVDEISEKLDIDIIKVYNFIVPNCKRITTEEERQGMIRLRDEGYTYTAIAKIFRRSRSCVRDRINKSARIHVSKNHIDIDTLNNIEADIDNDKKMREIIKQYDLNRNALMYRLKHTGYGKYSRVSKKEENGYIKMRQKGYTYKQISEKYNRSLSTIGRHLKDTGNTGKNRKKK